MGVFTSEHVVSEKSRFRPALTSGFCGVLTSFSSWIYAITKTNNGNVISETLCGLLFPLTGYFIGKKSAQFLPHRKSTKSLGYSLAVLLVLAPFIIFPFQPDMFNVVTLALAVVGCLLRFVLTKLLNREISPFGTLLSNLFACIIITVYPGEVSVKDGLCGGLSTVSLFIHELATIRKVEGMSSGKLRLYLLLSVGLCSGISVLIDHYYVSS